MRVQGVPAPGWTCSRCWLNSACNLQYSGPANKAVLLFRCKSEVLAIEVLHGQSPARLTVSHVWAQPVQPLPSSLRSVPCCFFRASLSNPAAAPTGNLIAPDLFRCSSRWNKYLLKTLLSEEPSPLQLPSALAKCPPLMCTHRTSFSFVSFIWGNSWTTPAVSLRKQFRKWGDNLSPSWALRLASGRVAD